MFSSLIKITRIICGCVRGHIGHYHLLNILYKMYMFAPYVLCGKWITKTV